MIEIGSKAPDFTLTSHLGDEINLSDYQKKHNVVLSFHIYSFTGG
jgi:peroxiredoxin